MGRLIRLLSIAIAVICGLIVFIGYLLPISPLAALRDYLVRSAVIVAAFAFILGFFNVLRVHLRRMSRGGQNGLYSGLLILAALISLGVTSVGLTVAHVSNAPAQAVQIATTASGAWFRYVLSPLQASVTGLIAFTLTMAAFRLLHNRRDPRAIIGALVFLLSAVIILLSTLQLPGRVGEVLTGLRQTVLSALATAGMRGILIGVGLGTLLMGLRIITGLDRPYSDS